MKNNRNSNAAGGFDPEPVQPHWKIFVFIDICIKFKHIQNLVYLIQLLQG